MKNTALTSLLLFMFLNGLVFSQASIGKSEDFKLTERTVIRDSLGNVLKLSDCSEYLDSDDWLFKPEKNEQGKVLYFLLRKTTNLEKELLSDARVSAINEGYIKRVKRGKFYIQLGIGNEIEIRRRRKKQIEYSLNAAGERVEKTKYRIVWSDDLSYVLTLKGKRVASPIPTRYKVSEIIDGFCFVRVLDEKKLGDTLVLYIPD